MPSIVYWRRELPPLSEQIEGEHEITADSARVHGAWGDRDALWSRCHDDLMSRARARIGDEVTRLGGSCAHVVDEVIAVRRDDGSGDFWLSGTFRYVMYVHPPAAITP